MFVKDLAGRFSFYAPILFSGEESGPVWVPAAFAGEWYNPKHGDIEITKADLANMLSNFKQGIFPPKPQQLPIDYEHLSQKPIEHRRPGDGIAAAWILDLELRNDGAELWQQIDLTEPAKEKVRKKEYKGLSPMFHPNFPRLGKKTIGPTLLGGALTNYQTIPSCILSFSLDPDSKGVAFASVEDLPYSERERRVREAIALKFPPTMKAGEPDYASYAYVRFVFDDRVTFERGDKVYSLKYSFDDELGVTFEGDPYEVVITDTPVVSLSTESHMKVLKVKNAAGQEVEIPVDALTLDALADVPSVKELQQKAAKPSGDVVSMSQYTALETQVQTLSATVESVKTENATLKTTAAEANAKLLSAEIDSLIAQGRMLPAEKDEMIELANSNRALFEKMVAKRKAAEPIIKLAANHGSAGAPANGGSAVVQFDALVESEKAANPKGSYADAILSAAKKNPELARQRNIEMSLPVGPGGVIMANS